VLGPDIVGLFQSQYVPAVAEPLVLLVTVVAIERGRSVFFLEGVTGAPRQFFSCSLTSISMAAESSFALFWMISDR
jgi:hypothetical protein